MTLPAQAITVISNASVDRSELELKDVRAIFTMKKRLWSDGQPIQVYVLNSEQSSHREFCKKVLGVFPRQLQSIWHRLVYSGTGQAPIELSSEQEMIDVIASTKGAIGYIKQENTHEQINTLSIRK
jgi:ABC-type phosphate transport system substrate-binding protein